MCGLVGDGGGGGGRRVGAVAATGCGGAGGGGGGYRGEDAADQGGERVELLAAELRVVDAEGVGDLLGGGAGDS